MVNTPNIVTTEQSEVWEELLGLFPAELQDIHLRARYYRMYELNGDGSARLFVYRKQADCYIQPFLLRSVPAFDGFAGYYDIESAYGYAGPVSTTEDLTFLAEADAAFCDYCKEQNVITEFVRFHPLLRNHRFVSSGSTLQLIHLRDYVTVDLRSTATQAFEAYTPQNRNKIRKAENAGYRVHAQNSEASFGEFVHIYMENMKQLGASQQYYFSPAYFGSLQQLTLTDGVLLTVEGSEGAVGAGIFLKDGPWAHYFLSSVTPEGRKNGVGNLLLHEGINWARHSHCRTMHLGGGLSADPNDPLLTFKQNFSKETMPFYIGKRVHLKGEYDRLIAAWEDCYPQAKDKYTAILQRYHWTEKDLPSGH